MNNKIERKYVFFGVFFYFAGRQDVFFIDVAISFSITFFGLWRYYLSILPYGSMQMRDHGDIAALVHFLGKHSSNAKDVQ